MKKFMSMPILFISYTMIMIASLFFSKVDYGIVYVFFFAGNYAASMIILVTTRALRCQNVKWYINLANWFMQLLCIILMVMTHAYIMTFLLIGFGFGMLNGGSIGAAILVCILTIAMVGIIAKLRPR